MIVVCGEALIDLFVGRPDAGGIATQAVAGGSPFNVALGVARLGVSSAFLSTLSQDAFGEFLLMRLQEAGVETRFVRRVPESTTLSVVAPAADGHPHYTFHSQGADRALAPADLPDLPESVAAIAAGSYALGVEPIGSALATLIRREGDRRVISLDPNVRPRVVGDVAAFRSRFEALLPHAAIVKGSAEDLEHFYGTRDLATVARDWLARGPGLVVVTRGEQGPLAAFRGEVVERPTPRVDVVDTVGAGDAFTSGLLDALAGAGLLRADAVDEIAQLSGDRLAGMLSHAVKVAAYTCTQAGAQPPTREALDAWKP
jgi:fructokinase